MYYLSIEVMKALIMEYNPQDFFDKMLFIIIHLENIENNTESWDDFEKTFWTVIEDEKEPAKKKLLEWVLISIRNSYR